MLKSPGKAPLKNPKEFAYQILKLYHGNVLSAQRELFNAARAFPEIPCQFFQDCYRLLDVVVYEEECCKRCGILIRLEGGHRCGSCGRDV